MTKHKVSVYDHKTWRYYVCGEHGRAYNTLVEVELEHPEGFELETKPVVAIIERRS